MSQQIQITGGAKVRNLEGVLTGTAGVVNALGINVPSGIPQLDGSGKILVSQLPNSVMEYKGTWNAATNTPTLANGTGNQGDVYLVSVAGTVNFGAGPITFAVGDQVIYSGTIWQKAGGSTGTVTSVAVTESGDALTITGSPITTSGTINIGFAGTSGQYVNGAGGLTTFPSLTGFVPYTGATANVNLGTFDFTADVITGATGSFASSGSSDSFTINHSSGSGIALNITKGGNGEGLYVNKTSGSGNAATITGGVTLLSELHLTTDLADAYIASAATWNAKQNAITLTTIGSSGAATLVGATLNIPNYGSALSAYVPYTGATANLNLGTFGITSGGISSNGIAVSQSGAISVSSGATTINGDANGIRINPVTASSNFLSFPSSGSRTYTYPNATGTLALTTDLGAYLPLTGGTLSGQLSILRGSGTGLEVASDLVIFRASTGFGSPRQITLAAGNGPTTYLEAKGYGGNYITDFGIRTYNSSGTAFEVFFATSAGDVGIGNTAPAAKLDVNGSVKGSQFFIGGTPTNTAGFTNSFFAESSYPSLTLKNTTSPASSYTIGLGTFGSFGIWDNTRSEYPLYITSGGNVGIGNTNPNSPLDVTGTIRTRTGSGSASLLLRDTSAASKWEIGHQSNNLYFYNYTAGASSMTITGSGNLLVGTSTEVSGGGRLQVQGTNGAVIAQLKSSSGMLQLYPFFSTYGGPIIQALDGAGSSYVPLRVECTTMTVAGNQTVTGTKSFAIEHPLDANKTLLHYSTESPKADLIYRGKVSLVNGKAQINIDLSSKMTEGTFVALCRDVQCFTTNETGWDMVKGKVNQNILTIESNNEKSNDEISWMVIGERYDESIKNSNMIDKDGDLIVEKEREISTLILNKII